MQNLQVGERYVKPLEFPQRSFGIPVPKFSTQVCRKFGNRSFAVFRSDFPSLLIFDDATTDFPVMVNLNSIDASIDGAPRVFNDGADVRQQLDESLMDVEQTLRNILPCV